MIKIRNIAILAIGIALIYSFTSAPNEAGTALKPTDILPGISTTVIGGNGCSTQFTVKLYLNGVYTGLSTQTVNCVASIGLCNYPANSYDVFADNGGCSGWHKKVKWLGGCLGIVTDTVYANDCYAPGRH